MRQSLPSGLLAALIAIPALVTAAPIELPATGDGPVDMIIVTTADLVTSFQPLADWKTTRGTRTAIVTVDWIDANFPSGQDAPERVRLFLQRAHRDHGTRFVLIGGDHERIPARLAWSEFFSGGDEAPSDQYFACVEGDWNADGDSRWGEGLVGLDPGDNPDLDPDLFVGRAPVETALEATTFVGKVLAYERMAPAGWVESVSHFAEVLFPSGWEFGDDPGGITLDGVYLTQSLDAQIDPLWSRTNLFQSDNSLDLAASLVGLEAGSHLVTLFTHSDDLKISMGNGASPFVLGADVAALTNGPRQSILFANDSGNIEAEGIGESFLLNPNGGAAAVYALSTIEFPLHQLALHEEALRLAFHADVTRLGVWGQLARVPFITQNDDAYRWTIVYSMLLGDPEMRMWTREPGMLDVTHAASLPLDSAATTVTVTDAGSFAPVPGALVCLSDGNGTYARGRTDVAGQVTLQISSGAAGPVNVVATAANYRPSETVLTLDPIGSPLLAQTAFVLNDDGSGASSGNANGVAEGGESVEWIGTLVNGGGSTAAATVATASVEAGSQATFDILWNGVRDASRVFVGPDRVSPASIPFTLDFLNPVIEYIGAPPRTFADDAGAASDVGVFVWQDQSGWHLVWGDGATGTPVSGQIVTDGRIRGTDRRALEVGETLALSGGDMVLDFAGATAATDLEDGVDFRLADNSALSVASSPGSLGDVAAGGTLPGTTVLNVATTAREGQVAYVDLTLVSTSGGPWSVTLPMVLGSQDLVTGVPTMLTGGPSFLLGSEPNPFRASTRLSFSVPAPADVVLDVLDVRGRRVRGLLAGSKSAGAHGVTWDGRDDSGMKVGSGVYFVRLRAGHEVSVEKVVRLK